MIHWRSIAGRLNKSLVIVVHCRAACAQGGWPRAISGVFTPRANCVRGCSWVSRVYTLWMISVSVDCRVYSRERTAFGILESTSRRRTVFGCYRSTPLRVNCLRSCRVSHLHPEDNCLRGGWETTPWVRIASVGVEHLFSIHLAWYLFNFGFVWQTISSYRHHKYSTDLRVYLTSHLIAYMHTARFIRHITLCFFD